MKKAIMDYSAYDVTQYGPCRDDDPHETIVSNQDWNPYLSVHNITTRDYYVPLSNELASSLEFLGTRLVQIGWLMINEVR